MYGNYGYNPYMQPQYNRMQPQPMQQSNVNENMTVQPVNNAYKLNGKVVDNIEVVKGFDIPLDGSTSYFPLADSSAIVTKQLQMDGTSKMVVYKPIVEKEKEVKYVTYEDLEKSLKKYDTSDLEDEISEIKKELKEFKKSKKKEEAKDE